MQKGSLQPANRTVSQSAVLPRSVNILQPKSRTRYGGPSARNVLSALTGVNNCPNFARGIQGQWMLSTLVNLRNSAVSVPPMQDYPTKKL